MATTQAFCLRRNNHPIDMIEDFEKMFKNEDLVDVSLSCEDGTIRAHKVILSACSSYFRQILSKFTSPYQYPVLIIKDMCFADLKAIIEFIYRGEVTVPQEQLTSVLKSAEALKVKGLADVNNQKCGIGHKFSSVADANDPTGVGSSNSSARKRKRRRRKDQENREKSSTGGALNSNSSGRSGADRSGQVSDEELNKQLLASTDASEYSEEEDELSTSHNLHPSQHTSHHQHLQLAPAHHQTNSAISVISSEGDIEPSRLLEQTMITGDAQNIGNLQSMNPVGSSQAVKQLMYDESSGLMPHLSGNQLNSSDQSSMTNHNISISHFEQATSINAMPGPSSLSQLMPRPNDDTNYSNGSTNDGGGANGTSSNLISHGTGTSLIPLQMMTAANHLTNGSSSNSSSALVAALSFESLANRRNYQCPICLKSFTEKGNMKRHTQIHMQQRNRYMCDVCSRCFAWKDNFNRHRRIAHSDCK